MSTVSSELASGLTRLRERFTAVNLRSRTVRLNRCTRSGALDLGRLERTTLDAVCAALGGSPDDSVALTDMRPAQLEQAVVADELAALAQHARADWLETGLRDLAVGWPLLEGKAPDGTWLRAPLVLFPAWLEATTEGRLHWRLVRTGTPELNASLVQTLRRLCGAVPVLDLERGAGIDAATWTALLVTLRACGLDVTAPEALPERLERFVARSESERNAQPTAQFSLHHTLVLARFPPSGSAIVGDYDALLAGPLTAERLGLACELLRLDAPAADHTDAHDTLAAPPPLAASRTLVALDSDSSQDAVLAWAEGDAPGLVVQGPPGTGKSQLIANLVTASLAAGRRVLVVCEKRAALDVVAQRLAACGLAEPLAVVHDVSADRTPVCQAIAATLAALAEPSPQSAAHVASPEAALERLHSRLQLAQQAFDALVERPDGRPALADLDERALTDPGHPLPDLRRCLAGVGEPAAEALLPSLEALARDTEPLAAPHPLAARGDWQTLGEEALAGIERAVRVLAEALSELAALDAGCLTARQAERHRDLFAEAAVLLDLVAEPDAAELDRFLLFWAWAGGDAAQGEWHTVMQALRRARAELKPTPWELVVEKRATLERWLADLTRLEALGGRWWRAMAPDWWRLRKLPGQILDRCPSLYASREAHGGRGAPVNVARLCRQALDWQALIDSLPRDNPFLDFGFQGSPAELEDAMAELATQHDRVRALHRLAEVLRGCGEPYRSLPRFEQLSDPRHATMLAAALADRRRLQLATALRDALSQLAALEPPAAPFATTLAASLSDLVEAALDGDLAPAQARCESLLAALERGEGRECVRLDRLTARAPAWQRVFLRGWRRHPQLGRSAGDDARLALERGWRALALEGRSRRALEAPLVDAELLAALAADLEQATSLAAGRVLERYRERIRERFALRQGGKHLRQLAQQARKQRRRLTLRQLVEQFWGHGLELVRPVWLCSPDSVASLFPVACGLFDLVIFDEASQCPVEAALPVVVRARRIIVAGDDQQMPPSHFFRAGLDDADDGDTLLSSASLLELARVAWPSTTLCWHYRSRHESLVSFSNRAFYGGRLVTAPRARRAAVTELEGLHFERVDGLWRENTNVLEAERVVDRVAHLLSLRTPEGRPPSVGVVAFNLQQAELIEARLGARTLDDERLRALLAADRRRPPIEQLFVRNLENVQGDERDVIVFSVGYGPAEPGGRVFARFGPLGQVGGEKRLNVAITRARLGLHVLCSFDPEALDVTGTRHAGPRLLREWLCFVRAVSEGDVSLAGEVLDWVGERGVGGGANTRPQTTEVAGATGPGERTLDALAAALAERGIAVSRRHGIGARRLDLVLGAEAGDWQLGVECASVLAERSPLVRDVYLPRFHARLGWRVVRVTPGAWLEERDAVVSRLVEAVRG